MSEGPRLTLALNESGPRPSTVTGLIVGLKVRLRRTGISGSASGLDLGGAIIAFSSRSELFCGGKESLGEALP
jgi:hypothetical protein